MIRKYVLDKNFVQIVCNILFFGVFIWSADLCFDDVEKVSNEVEKCKEKL